MRTWSTVRLQEVAKIDRSGIAPADIADGTLYVGLEHIESGGRLLDIQPVSNGALASTKFTFTPRHILYGKLRPYLAKIATPNFSGICSTDILPILPGPKLDRSYLTHYLRQPSMVDYATSRSEGANLPRLSPKVLAEFKIPLPPLKEQKRIAAILDQADALRRTRGRAIERLNTLGQSIFYEMFGDPSTNPKGWPLEPLSLLGNVVTGTTPPSANKSFFEGEVPFVTPGDLESGKPVKRHLSEEGAKKSRVVTPGATFVCCIGATIGKIDMARDRSAFNQQINAVQWHDKITPEYGMYALKALRHVIIHKGKGASTTLPILKKSEFQKLAIPVPPKELQITYSARLREINSQLEKLKNARIHLVNLFASLQQRAFRGEL